MPSCPSRWCWWRTLLFVLVASRKRTAAPPKTSFGTWSSASRAATTPRATAPVSTLELEYEPRARADERRALRRADFQTGRSPRPPGSEVPHPQGQQTYRRDLRIRAAEGTRRRPQCQGVRRLLKASLRTRATLYGLMRALVVTRSRLPFRILERFVTASRRSSSVAPVVRVERNRVIPPHHERVFTTLTEDAAPRASSCAVPTWLLLKRFSRQSDGFRSEASRRVSACSSPLSFERSE